MGTQNASGTWGTAQVSGSTRVHHASAPVFRMWGGRCCVNMPGTQPGERVKRCPELYDHRNTRTNKMTNYFGKEQIKTFGYCFNHKKLDGETRYGDEFW